MKARGLALWGLVVGFGFGFELCLKCLLKLQAREPVAPRVSLMIQHQPQTLQAPLVSLALLSSLQLLDFRYWFWF